MSQLRGRKSTVNNFYGKLKFRETESMDPDLGRVNSIGYWPNVCFPIILSEWLSTLSGPCPLTDPGAEPGLSNLVQLILFCLVLTGCVILFLSGVMR